MREDHSEQIRQTPVARTTFTLSDRNAFAEAIRLAAGWMTTTSGAKLPPEAFAGEEFSFSPTSGRAEASALKISDETGQIWAAQISLHDPNIKDRVWQTDLFVENRKTALVRFGVQLICRGPVSKLNFEPSRPRLVRNIIEDLAAETDATALTNDFVSVDRGEVEELLELIFNPDRRIPVVVASTDFDGRAEIDLDKLSNRVSGTAHLRSLPVNSSYDLTDLVGKRLSVFNGAVRIYMPGIEDITSDPYQHPLWLAQSLANQNRAIQQIVSRILPLGFKDSDGESRFWRLSLLRQAASRTRADTAKSEGNEEISAELDALIQENAALKEEFETAESLLGEAGEKLSAAQADLARLADENEELRDRIRRGGESQLGAKIDCDDIESLVFDEPSLETSLKILANIFPDRLIVLESAFDSSKASRKFKSKRKAFNLLWRLCTSYWTEMANGAGDVEARKTFGKDGYAAKESENLSAAGRKRRTFAHGGKEIMMEKHLKIGVADNASDTLRIHFEWISETRSIVIGHCGAHLDF